MGYLEFCSNCGKKNKFGEKEGNNRFYCLHCHTIHYDNPKPTATLICPKNDSILLVKRATDPGKGLWGLPGGFIEKGETPEAGAERELLEETNLTGIVRQILGTCSHFNTIFKKRVFKKKFNNTNIIIENYAAGNEEKIIKFFKRILYLRNI